MGKTRTDGAERNLGQDDLSEYLRAKEPGRAELAGIWRAAIGLQKVDGLTPSAYLVETARRNIEGEITIAEAGKIIGEYYKSKAVRAEAAKTRTDEADIVSQRITEILAEPTFSFSPEQLVSIHRRLFDGIYKHAGTIRDYNITKNEWVLKGDTVQYASCFRLVETMAFDFSEEKKFSYAAVSMDEVIRHFSKFIAGIWQIHPFGEGNTRTTSTFAMKYLRTLGFDVDNDIFYDNSYYFRNALVRANYSNIPKGIEETTEYLERFFRNIYSLSRRSGRIDRTCADLVEHGIGVAHETGRKHKYAHVQYGHKYAADAQRLLFTSEKNSGQHNVTFTDYYLSPALKLGLVEMTQPNSPRSPTQKYRLTPKGLAAKGGGK